MYHLVKALYRLSPAGSKATGTARPRYGFAVLKRLSSGVNFRTVRDRATASPATPRFSIAGGERGKEAEPLRSDCRALRRGGAEADQCLLVLCQLAEGCWGARGTAARCARTFTQPAQSTEELPAIVAAQPGGVERKNSLITEAQKATDLVADVATTKPKQSFLTTDMPGPLVRDASLAPVRETAPGPVQARRNTPAVYLTLCLLRSACILKYAPSTSQDAVEVAIVVPSDDPNRMTGRDWASLVLLALTLLGLYAGECGLTGPSSSSRTERTSVTVGISTLYLNSLCPFVTPIRKRADQNVLAPNLTEARDTCLECC